MEQTKQKLISIAVPVYNEQDELVMGQIINIGYAVDHRVIDGGDAAKFLEVLVKYLENPILLIM